MKMIFAVGPNNEFGVSDGSLPWKHISEDMKHFNAYTKGTVPVMGRLTWESLPKAKLPGRQCVVISQSGEVADPRDSVICASIPEALAEAKKLVGGIENVCIIGGASLLLATAGIIKELSVSSISASAMKAPEWDKQITYVAVLDIIQAATLNGLDDFSTILNTENVVVTLIK